MTNSTWNHWRAHKTSSWKQLLVSQFSGAHSLVIGINLKLSNDVYSAFAQSSVTKYYHFEKAENSQTLFSQNVANYCTSPFFPMDVHICMFHILAVIHMYDTAYPSPCNSEFLSAFIIQSQTLMRDYALRELKEAFAYRPNTATVTNLAHCCVSQRDIQVCCCVLLTTSSFCGLCQY